MNQRIEMNRAGRFTAVALVLAIAGLLVTSCSQPCVGAACDEPVGAIEGTLTLSDGAPPLAIEVALLGTERRALTSGDGRFAFNPVEPGSYMLRAAAPGYDTLVLNATVATGVITTVSGTLVRASGVDGGLTDGGTDGGSDGGLEPLPDAGIDAGPVGADIVNGHAFLLGAADHGGIHVSVTGGPQGATFSTTTAEDGSWRLTQLQDGAYVATFSAPLFEDTTVRNIITAPGTVTVDDVTLERSAQIDDRVLTSATYLADGERVLLNVTENGLAQSALYDAATHTVTDIISLGSTLRGQSADGQFATLTLADGSLRRWTIATGLLDTIAPTNRGVFFVNGEATVYLDSQSNVMLVRAAQQTPTQMLAAPCANATVNSPNEVRVDPLNYLYVRCGPSSGFSAYVATGPGHATGWLVSDLLSDDRQHLVTAEYPGVPGAGGTTVIRRYSQPDFLPVTIGHGLVGEYFNGYDQCSIYTSDCPQEGAWFLHDETADGQSLSTIRFADAAVETLATDFAPEDTGSIRGVMVGQQGPNGDHVVVDLLRRQTTVLCSGGDRTFLRTFYTGLGASNDDPLVACREGTKIKAFHSVSGEVQSIEIGEATTWSLQSRTLRWQDATSSYAMLMSDTTPVDIGYDFNYGGTVTQSQSGESFIRSFNDSVPRWVNLKTHETRTFLTGYFGSTSTSCAIHRTDNTAVCRFSVSSGTAPCGAKVCLSMLGPNGTSATVGAATGNGLSNLVWNTAGTGFVGSALLSMASGSPALTLLTANETGIAIGDDTAFGITRLGSSPYTYQRRDLLGGTLSPIPSTSMAGANYLVFNHASEMAEGDSVYHLNDNTVVTLGTGVTVKRIAEGGSVLTFVQGPTGAQTLGTYSATAGIRTLAERAEGFRDARGSTRLDFFWTDAGSSVGNLGWQDFAAGELHPLATSVSKQMATGRSDYENFVAVNADVTGSVGELAILDIYNKTVVPLGVRAATPPAPQAGTNRFTIAGFDAQGEPGFYVGELSGAGSKRLADTGQNAAFLAGESRVTFTSDRYWYIEGRATAPAVAVARWAEAPSGTVLSPDGKQVIFGLGGATPTAAMRHGIFVARLE